MKLCLLSATVFILNLVLWFLEWAWGVGFSFIRNEPIVLVGYVAFVLLGAIQVLSDIRETRGSSVAPTQETAKSYEAAVAIGSAMLLAVSLLVSLNAPELPKASPHFTRLPFYKTTLLTFLWIVIGVFSLDWIERHSTSSNSWEILIVRRIKLAAFYQAVGWATSAAAILITILQMGTVEPR